MEQLSIDTASARLALDEMRGSMEKKWQASDALSANGYQLLAASGVILVLAVTVTAAPQDRLLALIYWLLLAIAFAIYLVMLGTVLTATQPVNFSTGIKADWDILQRALLQQNELQATLTLVSTYVEGMSENEALNQTKARHIRAAMWLLVVIVFLLLFARAVAGIGSLG